MALTVIGALTVALESRGLVSNARIEAAGKADQLSRGAVPTLSENVFECAARLGEPISRLLTEAVWGGLHIWP